MDTGPFCWLVLRLEAPLVSFGDVAVDGLRPTARFPGQSMVTGLLGAALGWGWTRPRALARLQDCLVCASFAVRCGPLVEDLQSAQLAADDVMWTTRGVPEGRAGATYGPPYQRRCGYWSDAAYRVVLRVREGAGDVSGVQLEAALLSPARVLSIGRRACLPGAPLLGSGNESRWVRGRCAYDALGEAARGLGRCEAQWPVGEGPVEGINVKDTVEVADVRAWEAGFHQGARVVVRGWVGDPAA